MSSRNNMRKLVLEEEPPETRLRDRMEKLLVSKNFSDCSFSFGNGARKVVIPAHKVILCCASPWFRDLRLDSYDNIPVEDVEPKVFKTLLRYMYTYEEDNIKLDCLLDGSHKYIIQVWYAACKFELNELAQYCLKDIKVNPANCFYAYNSCKKANNDNCGLKFNCERVIAVMTSEVFKSDCKELEPRYAEELFGLENMNIDECNLFKYLDEFATAHGWKTNEAFYTEGVAGNQLDPKASDCIVHIREAVKKIRFLAMSVEEFNSCAAVSGRLTKDEVENIRECYRQNNELQLPIGFSRIKQNRFGQLTLKELPGTSKTKESSQCMEFSLTRNSNNVSYNIGVSNTFVMMNLRWKIIIYERKNTNKYKTMTKKSPRYYVYLYCDGDETDEKWKCYAQVDIIQQHENLGIRHFNNIPWFCFQSKFKFNCAAQDDPRFLDILDMTLRVETSLFHVSRKNPDSRVTVNYDRHN